MLSRLNWILRAFLKVFLYILGILFLIFIINYITCPVYQFKEGHPFTGEFIYNPYQQMNPAHWHKGNFQVQSRAWGGITSGRGNSNEDIHQVYRDLGYEIIATSDYQRINHFRSDDPSYIRVYEHGYNIQKAHQVLIGAERVLWKDYPFFQTIHNKQNILNKLRTQNELVFIAHPKLRMAYSIQDMQKLSNYDGIEVLNIYETSDKHWDAALSSGNYVTIIGNDDAHDITNPDQIGYLCTMINASSPSREEIIPSLKMGNAFGVKIWRPKGEPMQVKIIRTKILPELQKAFVSYDTFYVQTDSLIEEIKFIGQDGKVIQSDMKTNDTYYVIQPEDTYIRAEITFVNKVVFYLNPVCRYDGITPASIPPPSIDIYRTWLLRITGFSTLLFLIINFIIFRKRLRKSNRRI